MAEAAEAAASPEVKVRQKPTTWLFPRLPVRDVKFISEKLEVVSQGEKMRRTLLLDACKLADSGPTRAKLIVSQAYGLTKGGCYSDFIEPTDLGMRLATHKASAHAVMMDIITGNEYFKKFHERYADKRVPSEGLLIDWAQQLGVPEVQAKAFADVIIKNATDAGLIARRSNSDTFISLDEARELHPEDGTGDLAEAKEALETHAEDADANDMPLVTHGVKQTPNASNGAKLKGQELSFSPTIHIDVQVHISPESTLEQINAIFAGMAKHLYGRDSG